MKHTENKTMLITLTHNLVRDELNLSAPDKEEAPGSLIVTQMKKKTQRQDDGKEKDEMIIDTSNEMRDELTFNASDREDTPSLPNITPIRNT